MTTPEKLVDFASSFALSHYKENKNNDNIFGKWYGVNNVPWCAIFVSYCFNKVGARVLVAAGNPKGFASCTTAVNCFNKNKRLVPARKAQTGDVVFMTFSGVKNRFDHVGIVISNDVKNKVLHTVEGNTVNPNGTGDQVNGDGVYFKTRPYGYVTAVARPNWGMLVAGGK
jgi:hypothetical protein